MRLFILLFAMAWLGQGHALAQTTADSMRQKTAVALDADAVRCAPGKCPRFKHSISFPANALSHSSYGTFGLHTRGVDWIGKSGSMSLSMRRPQDFTGDRIRLLLLYEVGDDSEGQIQFGITPVSLHHGSGFETYGSFNTVAIEAPESLTIIHERSVVITTGSGWSATGDWWYFEIGRPGSFEGKLRLMSVAVEY